MKNIDIDQFIIDLDQKQNFFNGVGEINKYNADAIAELIQYYNIKEYEDPLFKKVEIKKAVEKYFVK